MCTSDAPMAGIFAVLVGALAGGIGISPGNAPSKRAKLDGGAEDGDLQPEDAADSSAEMRDVRDTEAVARSDQDTEQPEKDIAVTAAKQSRAGLQRKPNQAKQTNELVKEKRARQTKYEEGAR